MKKRPKEVRIEYELTDLPLTAMGGLPVVIEAAKALGIDHLFDKYLHVKLRDNGYRESELAMAVILTLDVDATIIKAEGKKREGVKKAFDGTIGFQPLLVFAAEPGLLLAHDFRPANVHPGNGAVELLKHAQTVIPKW